MRLAILFSERWSWSNILFQLDRGIETTVLVPGFDRDRLQIFLHDSSGKEASLLDLLEERNIVINGIAAHEIPIIDLFDGMLIHNIDRQINLIFAEVRQDVWLFALV